MVIFLVNANYFSIKLRAKLIVNFLALKLKSSRLVSIEFAMMILHIDLNFEFTILECAAGKSYNMKRKI